MRGVEALVRALEGVPAHAARVVASDDGDVVVQHGSQTTALHPIWVGEGFPRDVSNHVRRHDPTDARLIYVAREFSPGALDILTGARLSWADQTGRMSVTAPGLFIERVVDNPTPRAPRKARTMSWSPGAKVLAEVILSEVSGAWRAGETRRLPRVKDLAEQAGITSGYVSRVLAQFDARRWTSKVGGAHGPTSGRLIVDPGRMLDAWAQARTDDDSRVLAHTLTTDPRELVEQQLATTWPEGRWMVTGWTGLEERAPWATSTTRTDLYLDETLFGDRLALNGLLEAADLMEVASGERVTVRPAPTAALRLAMREGSVPVASDVRLYADLLSSGGVRGADAAEHLRSTRIGF